MQPEVAQWLRYLERLLFDVIDAIDDTCDVNTYYKLRVAKEKYSRSMDTL